MTNLCADCWDRHTCPMDGRDRTQCNQYVPPKKEPMSNHPELTYQDFERPQLRPVPEHYDLGGGRDIHDIERSIWGDDAHAKHLLMAAFEYIARAHKKGSNVADIGKAIDCLQKAKQIVEEQGK